MTKAGKGDGVVTIDVNDYICESNYNLITQNFIKLPYYLDLEIN